jgi:hypothetical protein
VDASAYPKSQQEVLERIDSISEESKSALRIAAAIGMEFSSSAVALLGRLDGELVKRALAEATAAGLVEALPGEVERYLFTAAIVRDALEGRPSPREPSRPSTAVLRREGEYWSIAHEGVVARLKDAKGLHYISRLIAEAGERLPAAELVLALGNPRPDAEHARMSVSKAIRGSLTHIARQNPFLGQHLRAAIRTGAFCSYSPDPRLPVTWSL